MLAQIYLRLIKNNKDNISICKLMFLSNYWIEKIHQDLGQHRFTCGGLLS